MCVLRWQLAELKRAETASVEEQNEMIMERLRAAEHDLELQRHESSQFKVCLAALFSRSLFIQHASTSIFSLG